MQEKRREKAQCWRSKSQALRQTVMSRGLINGTAISNGMLSWKVSHREPPASLLTDSQERKEEGREDGRKRREGRKRGKALCPGPCQLPFANDLGKGIMIFHSAEICQVSSNITGTGRWQWSEANAVHYFSPPSPPHTLCRDRAFFILPPLLPHAIVNVLLRQEDISDSFTSMRSLPTW